MKAIHRKKTVAPPFKINDQNIIYNPVDKAQALADNFQTVFLIASKLNSPYMKVVNDYILSLDNNMILTNNFKLILN